MTRWCGSSPGLGQQNDEEPIVGTAGAGQL